MQFTIKVTKQERKAGLQQKARLRAGSERVAGMTLLDYAAQSNAHAELAELEEELLPGLRQFPMIEECDEDEGQADVQRPFDKQAEFGEQNAVAEASQPPAAESRDPRKGKPAFQIRQLSKSKRNHPAQAGSSKERGKEESPMRLSFYSHHYPKIKEERRTHVNFFTKKVELFRPKAKAQVDYKRF